MSSLQDRSAARPPLVPERIASAYADAMARLPKVRLTVRRPVAERDLPAVASFYG